MLFNRYFGFKIGILAANLVFWLQIWRQASILQVGLGVVGLRPGLWASGPVLEEG